MRTHVNAASPFARKVRIVARETGLIARIEEIDTTVSPIAPNTELAAANPLIKIPALILDDGSTLYDSRVICEYLDSLAGHRLFPQDGAERWQALCLQSLCDGILDAAVLIRYETAVRPEALRWSGWVAGQRGKIDGGLAALEKAQPGFGSQFRIGQVGAACVLGYLDFRFPDIAWRSQYPRLAAWFAEASNRASIKETLPPA
jgi:glutathione S-transferase